MLVAETLVPRFEKVALEVNLRGVERGGTEGSA